jgi:hypothetical protein
MIKIIYITLAIIITFWTFYMYVGHINDYKNEMMRIKMFEKRKYSTRKKNNFFRAKTHPCHISGLFTPRDCYVKSDYKCKWDARANRCNAA